MDRSRQWGRSVRDIRADHVNRYYLAAKYAKGRVLDAACGCGYGTAILSKHASVVVGIDASVSAIQWAEENFPEAHYLLGKIEEEPWGGKFETVVSLETLEHLKEPKAALDAFRRSCSGFLIASVPNEERYPFKAEAFANDESPHYRHYTPDQFEELLEASGFKVKDRFCQISKHVPDVVCGTDGMYLIYVCR